MPGALAAAEPEPAPPPGPELPRTGKIADRTRARHAGVHRMLAEGRNFRETAAGLGLARNTVRRFARAASAEELFVSDGTGRQPAVLDEYGAYLLNAGTRAAPTPRSCGRNSATAAIRAVARRSATTSPVSVETKSSPLRRRARRRSGQ